MNRSAAQKMPLPQQRFIAASPDHSIWVNASAGTGKTNILTQRVLGLLLHGVKPERIVCLTYTKAAAAEMATRIRTRLGKWVAMNDAALFADVESIIGDEVTDKMLVRARLLFAQCLDTPDGLKIQTLHGFCQSVLQRFPLEAGLLPRFQVCEEREAARLLHQAMYHVLRRPDKEPELHGAIQLLSEILSQEIQLTSLLSKIIDKRTWLLKSIAKYGSIGSMLQNAAQLSGISGSLSKDGLMAQICADEFITLSGLRSACAALADGTDAESRRGIEIQNWLDADIETRIRLFEDYTSIFLTGEGEIRAKIINPKTAEKYPHALMALQAEAARIIQAQNTLKTLNLLGYNHAALTLAAEIFNEYSTAKQRIGALDYDDLIQYTLSLLQKPGIAPWILFKLDGGIDHLLIDEAQDTSPDQWQIVRLLTEEFFAGTGSKQRPTSVFAVGDPKQSIYSFQHADPRGFIAMQSHYTKAAFEIRQTLQVIPLQYSYRSTADVLRIVDSVFTVTEAKRGVSFFTQAEEQKKLLQNQALIEHIAMREDAPGIVEIWPLAQDSEKPKIRPWHIPDARQETFSAAEKMAGAIAHTIEQWLRDGEILPKNSYTGRDARKIQSGDIMILVRRRNEFVDLLTRALKNKNIPVAGVDRLILSEHIAIMDLLALAKFLLLPEDDLNLATLLKSPLLNLPPERAEELLFDLCAAHGPKSVWQRLRETENDDLRKAHEYLAELLDRYSFLSPFELFSDILNRLHGRKRLIARLGLECIDPIDEFLNLCAGPAQNMHLQEFVAFMIGDTIEIKRDLEAGERGEVRIMTVHASKGLQAPIVFLPDTTRLPKPKSTVAELLFDDQEQILLWPAKRDWLQGYSKQLRDRADQATAEEYRRLLYVALTRAEDRLYIGGYGAAEPDSWYSFAAQAGYDMTQNSMAKTADFDFTPHGFTDWQGSGWRIGNLPKVKIQLPEEAEKKKPITLPGWLHQSTAPADPTPPRPLSPSKPAAEPASISPAAQNGARGQKILRGKIIHRLLQTLPDMDSTKRPAVMRNFMKQYHSQIDAAESEEIIAEIETLLHHPEFTEYFGPSSRAEVPVSGKIGDKIIVGQIDRLTIGKDTIKILDFKTNRPAAADPTSTPEVYLRQMAAYVALLEKIYPQYRVEAALLWTNIAKLMPLPAAILARYKP